MTSSIRILIVDDHDIVRKGVKVLLDTEHDIEVCGEAREGEQAVAKAERLHPDVILMDLAMPGMNGVEAIRQINASQPEARILVLTSFATGEMVFPAIKAGALGYLLKDSNPQELIKAIREVHGGEFPFHPAIARKLLQEISNPPTASFQSTGAIDPLTVCEVEVLELLAQRHSYREIGEQLAISEAMVRFHANNILSKLHLASRT